MWWIAAAWLICALVAVAVISFTSWGPWLFGGYRVVRWIDGEEQQYYFIRYKSARKFGGRVVRVSRFGGRVEL